MECSTEKTNQRTYPFLGQLVVRIGRGAWLENDGQAVDQNSCGSTQVRDAEFAGLCAGFDYFTDRLRQEFPKITDYSARPAWTDTFFYRNTDGRCHDVNALDALMAEPGAFYVMDRGYLDLDGFNEEDLYSNLAWLPHRHG